MREREVEDLFAKYGRIRGVDLKSPARPPAYAFIEFDDARWVVLTRAVLKQRWPGHGAADSASGRHTAQRPPRSGGLGNTSAVRYQPAPLPRRSQRPRPPCNCRDAEDAVRARDGYDFYGNRLRVEIAKGAPSLLRPSALVLRVL